VVTGLQNVTVNFNRQVKLLLNWKCGGKANGKKALGAISKLKNQRPCQLSNCLLPIDLRIFAAIITAIH